MSEFYIRLAGLLFVILGAVWVGLGFYVDEGFVWLAGGLAAAAGVALMGVAPKLSARADSQQE